MRRFTTPLLQALLAAAILTVATCPRPANAQCIENGACLLPKAGCGYFFTGPTLYGGTSMGIRNVNLSAFTQCMSPPGGGLAASSFFDVFVELEFSTNGGATWAPAQTTAHSGEHVLEHADLINFDTEMLQLDLSGGALPPNVLIRESPTLQSLGSTALTDQGGGNFKIDSFFDVFTELSLDSGLTWHASGTVSHFAVTQETSTPNRASTWGSLKIRYR